MVSFLLAGVSCILAWGGGGGSPHCPCLSAWLSGCSQVTSNCTTIPGLPALLRHRGKSPGGGAGLGSSVQSCPMCSETLPFLFFFHRPCLHRVSKEEAHSEAEPEGHPASALSTEPLPWDSHQRTAGPGACIAKSRVQVGPRLWPCSPFQALHANPSKLKAPGGLSPEKEFSLFASRSGFKTNEENG